MAGLCLPFSIELYRNPRQTLSIPSKPKNDPRSPLFFLQTAPPGSVYIFSDTDIVCLSQLSQLSELYHLTCHAPKSNSLLVRRPLSGHVKSAATRHSVGWARMYGHICVPTWPTILALKYYFPV